MADHPVAKGRGAMLERLKKQMEAVKAPAPGPIEESAEKVPKSRGRAQLLQKLMEQKEKRAGGDQPEKKIESGPSTEPSSSRGVEEVSKGVRRLQVEETTPGEPCHYRGEAGHHIPASANYIELSVEKDRGVYEYEVRFRPDVDARTNRIHLVNDVLGEMATVKVYDGDVCLYLPSQTHEGVKEQEATMRHTDESVTVILIYKRKRRMSECLHLYNVLFKRIMGMLLFTRIGRNYFSPEHKHPVPQHKLEVLPGYAISVDEMEGGLMVCVDTQHRVIRTQTVYDLMLDLYAHNPGNCLDALRNAVIGESVLTKYNNQTYVIDDIREDMSPKDTFKTPRGDISYMEYYKRQHNIIIYDQDQLMLITKKPKKLRKPGEKDIMIALVPEVCYLTGLSDAMRSDFKVMKDVAVYTRITPNQRRLALHKYLENVRSSEKAQKILANWGLKLADTSTNIDARVLPQETIYFGPDQRNEFKGGTDWSRAAGENKVIGPVDIKKWLIFHTRRDERSANDFTHLMRKLAPNMGCVIDMPRLILLADDRTDTLMMSMQSNINPNIQVCVFICPTLRADRYSVIKKVCSVQTPVASQVILSKTLGNPAKVRTIVHKIALQITCKLGGTLWSVKMPFTNWMICGIDVYHGKGHQSVCGFISSINSSLTKYFSKAIFQEREIGDFFKMAFRKALEAYKKNLGEFPARIVFFRDGVGDGQLDHCKNYELTQFKEVLQEMDIAATVTFIVIQKRISTRIYALKGPQNADNPPAGTVVDRGITRRNLYDFYLIPQSVRQGTVNPTHYIVLHDEANIKPDHIQRLSYKLCHLYYNWSGTIRVPAPCQYAHKLAQLVGMYIKKEPHQALSERLHFL